MSDFSSQEDIYENVVFQRLQHSFTAIYRDVSRNGWTVLVPQSLSLQDVVVDQSFLECHISKPSPYFQGQFSTLDDRSLDITKSEITTGGGFPDKRVVKVLFEEQVYGKSNSSFRVICIERPLEGGDEAALEEALKMPLMRTYEETQTYLRSFPENTIVLRKIDVNVQSFVDSYPDPGLKFCSCDDSSSPSIVADTSSAGGPSLHAKVGDNADGSRCVMCGKRRGFGDGNIEDDTLLQRMIEHIRRVYSQARDDLCCANPCFRNCHDNASHALPDLERIIETYVVGGVRDIILRVTRKVNAATDERVALLTQAATRDNSITPQSLGIRETLSIMLSGAILELTKLDSRHSPAEKLKCLCDTIGAIAAGNPLARGDVVTTDDLIPALVYVVVHSRQVFVASDIDYIERFTFSNSLSSELGFNLVTFKAALAYLQSDEFSTLIPSRNLRWSETKSSSGGGSPTSNSRLFQRSPQLKKSTTATREADGASAWYSLPTPPHHRREGSTDRKDRQEKDVSMEIKDGDPVLARSVSTPVILRQKKSSSFSLPLRSAANPAASSSTATSAAAGMSSPHSPPSSTTEQHSATTPAPITGPPRRASRDPSSTAPKSLYRSGSRSGSTWGSGSGIGSSSSSGKRVGAQSSQPQARMNGHEQVSPPVATPSAKQDLLHGSSSKSPPSMTQGGALLNHDSKSGSKSGGRRKAGSSARTPPDVLSFQEAQLADLGDFLQGLRSSDSNVYSSR
eukprot:TRINITY_DN4267_c0_g1_i1.p1 TRINITY_DN4267_c0_g1~~TRINITY_DN4267_c0_g1_i1.p1  ORF type:complete len:739 (-),score=144.42 TRINITY_DN4267_c0_g1_i1:86-2302(-)